MSEQDVKSASRFDTGKASITRLAEYGAAVVMARMYPQYVVSLLRIWLEEK